LAAIRQKKEMKKYFEDPAENTNPWFLVAFFLFSIICLLVKALI
jgi:hypothetical protein